jgi:gentisate 1,2-dioxygenase
MTAMDEREVAHLGAAACDFRAEALRASQEFRRQYELRSNLVSAENMPFEHCADGLIKHMVHERMHTRECCIEAYMQFLAPGGRSGKHRHMWEEVLFVLEGSGYDLHWDLDFDCLERFDWKWAPEPKRFEWRRGDFVYVPPFTIHQHFNADPSAETRFIVISNRIVKEMGFDWFDQLEPAPGP